MISIARGGAVTGIDAELNLPAVGAVATPSGTHVVVAPTDVGTGTNPATLTFDTVTNVGSSQLFTTPSAPPTPSGYASGTPATYYDLSTTATFSGNVTVCIVYDPNVYTDPNHVTLWHYEDTPGAWVDVTTSLDTTSHVVCGLTHLALTVHGPRAGLGRVGHHRHPQRLASSRHVGVVGFAGARSGDRHRCVRHTDGQRDVPVVHEQHLHEPRGGDVVFGRSGRWGRRRHDVPADARRQRRLLVPGHVFG